MTNVERFQAVLSGHLPEDRLPCVEWAAWWDLTLKRWHGEGLDPSLAGDELFRFFNLDVMRQYWFPMATPDCPQAQYFGGPIIEDEEGYDRLLPYLYPEDGADRAVENMLQAKSDREKGNTVFWFSVDGAFWFPRRLLGIEGHLLSFYEQPELYHRILNDLADYQLKILEKMYSVSTPEFCTIAEDMSYNKGPMISEKHFDEFLLPYYQRIIPYIRKHGTKVFVDSDGDISMMVPWLQRAGFQGALPLEYQAGVDIVKLREKYPDFLMIGGFNKRVMKDGEAAMRQEFERVLPVMRSGGYIPGVDHQTPPDVSIDTYRIFVQLLHEYCTKAVQK